MSLSRSPIRAATIAGILALASVLGLAPAASASACTSASAVPASLGQRATVSATLCVLNAERASQGLRPLRLDSRLSIAARRHSEDMARNNYFDHLSRDGASFVDRIRRAGYLARARRWTVAENIAWGSGGSASPRLIARSWMNSPGHRANILSASYREIGVGVSGDTPIRGLRGATYTTTFGSRG